MKYKVIFTDDSTIYVPFKYQTVNANGTRTPIDLTGKRVTIEFEQRGGVGILDLDSDDAPNEFDSAIAITDAEAGEFHLSIPVAQSIDLRERFGRIIGQYELKLHDPEPRLLTRGPFSIR